MEKRLFHPPLMRNQLSKVEQLPEPHSQVLSVGEAWQTTLHNRSKPFLLTPKPMKHALLLALSASLVTVAVPAHSAELPLLAQTQLYTRIASDCVDLSLADWDHPVKKVLTRKDVALERVQLCNNKTLPVFFVSFKFDPQGLTQDYFAQIYDGMRTANGNWPYAFVATSDNTVITVSPQKGLADKRQFERYRDATQ
jgi:hypothetical protein